MKFFICLSLLLLGFWSSFQITGADHCDPKTDTKVLLPKADDKNYHYNATEEESCSISYRSILNPQQSPTSDDGCKIRGFHLNDGTVGPSCIPEIGELSRDELFSTNDLTQRVESNKLLAVFLQCTSFEDFKNAALYYKSKVNPMLFSYTFSTAIANREDTESFSLPSLHDTQPDLFFNNRLIEEANKKLNKDEIKSLRKFEERRTDFKKSNVDHEKKKYLSRPDKKVVSSPPKKIPQNVEDSKPRDKAKVSEIEFEEEEESQPDYGDLPLPENVEESAPQNDKVLEAEDGFMLSAPVRGLVEAPPNSQANEISLGVPHMDKPKLYKLPPQSPPKHFLPPPRAGKAKLGRRPPPRAGEAKPGKTKVKLLPIIPPPEEKEFIELREDRTGNYQNPEHRVSYFREDIAVNSHHWHWHTIYPMGWPKSAKIKDRKGELFYYMHCQMIKRYDGARLAEGLAPVKPLHVTESGINIEEGYYAHLTSTSTHNSFSGRPKFMKVLDVPRQNTLKDLLKWINAIKEAIKTHEVIDEKGNKITLNETNGIDLLGSAVESSEYSPNTRLYGDIHNLGHILISYCHDHKREFNSPPSVMFNLATAVRDPVFWRWHKMVDDLLNLHKAELPPYNDKYLNWKGIKIKSIDLTTNADEDENGQFLPNTGYTFFKWRPIELGRGLDFNAESSAVSIRIRHLDHMPFTYSLKVSSKFKKPVEGHVRIFISPKKVHGGRLASDDEIRMHAIEMDRFTVKLKHGENTIKRTSSENFVTMDPDSYWSELSQTDTDFTQVPGRTAFCGCGWPYHLLLPKGTQKGIEYVLFAMVSNWNNERKTKDKIQKICGSSLTMCGLKGKQFPDKRPMGFPLDRPIPNEEGWFKRSNMILKDIKIHHLADRDRD